MNYSTYYRNTICLWPVSLRLDLYRNYKKDENSTKRKPKEAAYIKLNTKKISEFSIALNIAWCIKLISDEFDASAHISRAVCNYLKETNVE